MSKGSLKGLLETVFGPKSGGGTTTTGGGTTTTPTTPTTPLTGDQKATNAEQKVKGLNAKKLKALPNAEKIEMLKDLRLGTAMTDEQKKAQRDIYNSMEMDKAFLKEDAKRRKKIADSMTDTKEKKTKLKKLKKDWSTASKDDKLNLMRDAIDAQSKALGFTPPEVKEINEAPTITKDGELIENGHFDPTDGKIYINTHPKSSFNTSMETALNLGLHENSHNYQKKLEKKVDDGTLKSGDTEYQQALMFKANWTANGYVEGKEDFSTYQKQPIEDHAHFNGEKTAKAIIKKL